MQAAGGIFHLEKKLANTGGPPAHCAAKSNISPDSYHVHFHPFSGQLFPFPPFACLFNLIQFSLVLIIQFLNAHINNTAFEPTTITYHDEALPLNKNRILLKTLFLVPIMTRKALEEFLLSQKENVFFIEESSLFLKELLVYKPQ